jgi:hypothetical protein
MAKHTEKPARMDGKSLSPQKKLGEFLKRQFPLIFYDEMVNFDRLKSVHECSTAEKKS